jgi:prepilin-type processing-associated H-X9-DG protein
MKLASVLVLVAIVAVAIAYLIPAIERARDRASLAMCADHLRAVGVGLAVYERASGGKLPLAATVDGPHLDILNCLAAAKCAIDAKSFYCPAQRNVQLEFSDENLKAGRLGYYWYPAAGITENPSLSKFLKSGIAWPHVLNTAMDPRSWVMSDIWVSGLPTAHAGYRKGLNYLMLDGSVAFTAESPRQSFH